MAILSLYINLVKRDIYPSLRWRKALQRITEGLPAATIIFLFTIKLIVASSKEDMMFGVPFLMIWLIGAVGILIDKITINVLHSKRLHN